MNLFPKIDAGPPSLMPGTIVIKLTYGAISKVYQSWPAAAATASATMPAAPAAGINAGGVATQTQANINIGLGELSTGQTNAEQSTVIAPTLAEFVPLMDMLGFNFSSSQGPQIDALGIRPAKAMPLNSIGWAKAATLVTLPGRWPKIFAPTPKAPELNANCIPFRQLMFLLSRIVVSNLDETQVPAVIAFLKSLPYIEYAERVPARYVVVETPKFLPPPPPAPGTIVLDGVPPTTDTQDPDQAVLPAPPEFILSWPQKMIRWSADAKSAAPAIAMLDTQVDNVGDAGLRASVIYPTVHKGIYGHWYPVAMTKAADHGTHIAGVIAGKDLGMFTNAKVVAYAVTDITQVSAASGSMYYPVLPALYSDAIQSIIQYDKTVRVVNASLGGPLPLSQYEEEDLQALSAADIQLVASAGNHFEAIDTAEVLYPAANPLALSVGAAGFNTDGYAAMTTFSNYTPNDFQVNLTGPGWHIYSTLANVQGRVKYGTLAHGLMRGTSQAAAYVSCALAYAVERNSKVDINDIGRRMVDTATGVDVDEMRGLGFVDCMFIEGKDSRASG